VQGNLRDSVGREGTIETVDMVGNVAISYRD